MIEQDLKNADLKTLFEMVDKIGSKRYHRLTSADLEDYRKYEHWRYIQADAELGSTPTSKKWVDEHSTPTCPVCGDDHHSRGGKNIDHKMPRAQYPWLSMSFQNFWVICRACNLEKAEMNWYEYERYCFKNKPDQYHHILEARPQKLLLSLVVEN
jgi:HNH endonuclease